MDVSWMLKISMEKPYFLMDDLGVSFQPTTPSCFGPMLRSQNWSFEEKTRDPETNS